MPVTDRTTEWWEQEDNVDAAGYLNSRIEQLCRTPTKWRGVYFSTLIIALYDRPSAITQWRDKATDEDKARHAAFKKMCRLLADSLPGGIEIFVQINPKALPASSKKQASARDREAGRIDSQAKAHHMRYDGYLAIFREFPCITFEAAKAMWSQRHDMSVATIRDSIKFCEKHEWPDGTRVRPHHRYGYKGEEPNGEAA